jgi:enterochelin esterase-like enzyme
VQLFGLLSRVCGVRGGGVVALAAAGMKEERFSRLVPHSPSSPASLFLRTVVRETYVGKRRESPTRARRGIRMEVRSRPPPSSSP